ncbi:MAG: hypothetical protein AAGI34_00215 [Pseudomonadota bacterium]
MSIPESLSADEREVLGAMFGRTVAIPDKARCTTAIDVVYFCTSTREFKEIVAPSIIERNTESLDSMSNWLKIEEAFLEWFGYSAMPAILNRDLASLRESVIADLTAQLAATEGESVTLMGAKGPVQEVLSHFQFIASIMKTTRSDDIQVQVDAIRNGVISGWAFDARRKCFPEIAWLVEGGKIETLETRRLYRPEVCDYLKFYDTLGFEVVLGEHTPRAKFDVVALIWPTSGMKYVRGFTTANQDYEPYAERLSSVMNRMSEEILRVSQRVR